MSTSARAARCLPFVSIVAAWLGVRLWGAAPATAAARAILESSALRVEVTASPYSYAVIEKATGQVLLRHAQTTFTVGTARSASAAVIGTRSATTLDATLTFAGACPRESGSTTTTGRPGIRGRPRSRPAPRSTRSRVT